VIVRILLWDVFESTTTLDELRATLPELAEPSRWIWNEATDRFGAILVGDDLPEALGYAQDLIGSDPDVYDEWDSA